MKKILASMCCLVLAVSMGAAGVAASAEEIMPENPDNEVIESTKDVLPEKSGAAVEQEESGDIDRGAFTCTFKEEYVKDKGKSVEVCTITGFDQEYYAKVENKNYNTNHTLEFPDKVLNKKETGWAEVAHISIDYANSERGWIGGKDSLTFTKVVIPNTVHSIGRVTFTDLKKLEFVDYQEGIKIDDFSYSGSVFFQGCSNLKKVGVNGTYRLPDYMNSYGSIGRYAFSNCESLTKVEIPEGITTFDTRSFQNCNSLKEINIPSTTGTIDLEAFLNCSSLSKVTFNLNKDGKSDIWFLNKSAFEGCTSLQSIKLPNSTNEDLYCISECCFKNSGLKGINIPDSVTEIGSEAFAGTNLDSNSLKTPKGEQYGIAFFGKNTSINEKAFTDNKTGIEIKPKIAAYEGTGAYKYAIKHVGSENTISLGAWDPYTTRGDINKDGIHNMTDIKLVRKWISNTQNLHNYDERYDINKDSKINFSDVKLLRKYVTNSYFYR